MDFFHAVMALEFFVAETLVPATILVPIPIFVVAIGMSMPMPRIFFVLMPVAVAIVIIMLRKSGHARGHTQCQNCGKAYSNQSHRCLSTAK
jgi:membrane protein implicated in regulation of membrane protease activity